VADPQGDVAKTFQNLGVCVVQQCAKIRQQGKLKASNLGVGKILQGSKKVVNIDTPKNTHTPN
jgi:hypothetical protein